MGKATVMTVGCRAIAAELRRSCAGNGRDSSRLSEGGEQTEGAEAATGSKNGCGAACACAPFAALSLQNICLGALCLLRTDGHTGGRTQCWPDRRTDAAPVATRHCGGPSCRAFFAPLLSALFSSPLHAAERRALLAVACSSPLHSALRATLCGVL